MRIILLFIAMVFLCSYLIAQSNYKALTGAVIINSNGKKPIENGTIIIKDNVIENIGRSKRVKIPDGADIIDLQGKYVVPGLIDAHMHFFQSGGLYTRPDGIDLNAYYPYEKEQEYIKTNLQATFSRYLAAGVTGVADVGGGMWNFEVREIARQTQKAPRVVVAGPLISTVDRVKLDIGDPPIVKVTSNEEVDELVGKLVASKADLIKIWFIVAPDLDFETNLQLIQRTIDQSHASGIRVAVHATQLNTAKEAVRAGCDILVHSIDDEEVDQEFIQLIKEKETIYTSSMAVLEGYKKIVSQDLQLGDKDYEIADPFVLNNLMDVQHIPQDVFPGRLKEILDNPKGIIDRSNNRVKMAKINLKKLQDAGVTIAMGTDAGNPGTFHGSAIFREFQLMTEAGLTSQQILNNATLNGAKLMGKADKVGSLEIGKLADILVLDANPLENISNLSEMHVLVKDGIVFRPNELLNKSPEQVIQRQVVAYNQRDLNKFLSFYSDDVQIFNQPDELLMDGKEAMRERYGRLFERSKDLHVEVVNRIVMGNRVVDQESVKGITSGMVNAVAIYEVIDGLINKVWFLRD